MGIGWVMARTQNDTGRAFEYAVVDYFEQNGYKLGPLASHHSSSMRHISMHRQKKPVKIFRSQQKFSSTGLNQISDQKSQNLSMDFQIILVQ